MLSMDCVSITLITGVSVIAISVAATGWMQLFAPTKIFSSIKKKYSKILLSDPNKKYYKFALFIYQPIFDCEMCLAGQAALWLSLYLGLPLVLTALNILLCIGFTKIIND